MVKFVRTLVCLIIILHTSSSWTPIECNYKDISNYHVLKNIYFCSVNNNPNILTRESAQISSINGEHMSSKSYNDVIGFDVRSKTIQVFPKGLHTYFKNLKVIYIETCGLKEIHQAELKPFPNLVYFFLASNFIEVIEEGLFDNNPNIEAIGFWESKIVHIDPNVFDKLTMLKYFWFSKTPCVQKDIWNSKDKVQEVLKLVKNQCTSSEYKIQKDQLNSLEIELRSLNSEDIKAKIEDFEKTFTNSRFSKFRPLRNKFEGLKNPKNFNSVSIIKSSVDLTSKVNLEPEKRSNVPAVDVKYQNLSLILTDEFGKIKTSLSELKNVTNIRYKDYLAPISEKLTNIEEKMTKFDDEITKINEKLPECDIRFENTIENLKEKLGGLQVQFTDFEVKNTEKYDKIEKELSSTRHKIAISFDEKIKGVEKRLIGKFEEILEEKLSKILEEKLGHLMEAKTG